MSLPDNPKTALENYISQTIEGKYQWYGKAVSRSSRYWSLAQFTSVIAGFFTALIAALLSSSQFSDWGTGRLLLIILPIIGSLASTYLIQSRIKDLSALREQGRITVENLKSLAILKFASAKKDEEYSEIHNWLITEITNLESRHANKFYSLVSHRITFNADASDQDKIK